MNALGVRDVAAVPRDGASGWRRGLPAPLGAVLERRAAEADGVSLFARGVWLEAAARHLVPAQARLWTYAGRDGSGPFSSCVVVRERWRGLPLRVLRLLGDPLSDRAAWSASDRADREELLDALVAVPSPWDVALLSELVPDAAERSQIDDWAGRCGLPCAWELTGEAPIVDLSDGVEAVTARYGKSLRTRLKRARKKIDAGGGVAVELHTPSPPETAALLDEVADIERASWKGDAGVGLFACPTREAFVRDAAAGLAAEGALVIALMRHGGTAIAYRLGFRDRGAFLDYNLAHRPEFGHLSPGRCLLDHLVRHGPALGVRRIDASRSSMTKPHLLREWPCDIRYHYRLAIYRNTSLGQLAWWRDTRLRPAVAAARRRLRPTFRNGGPS